MNIVKKLINKETFLYLIFGILTTVVNTVSFFLFNKTLNYKIANTLAFVLAIIFAYVTNKLYVFESKKEGKVEIIKEFVFFIGSRLFTFIIDMLLMVLFVEILYKNVMISKIIVNVVVIILNYILSKKLVFKR
ncbi:GtrA family protein [Leptotrichia sp. oral taxon 218]|uniref:GtrA family protein n=1 Tax=Leptotrichia sp. oral taxon 218 TaxID=712361 RepID=UPI001B8B7279|nr:GtrA family protein [Leptotrichia sp. oral taxon 218]QUB95283.1 GtrA family protein [Leptotrichia sp. oral taxon 218]